jgi:DNA-binding HxlR family transcriptional regulator
MGRFLEMKDISECSATYVLAVNDTINVISGKWKPSIMATLFFGKKRFGELAKEIPRLNPRMLSKELRDLEANGIVTRKVYDTIPVSVEYELTKSGLAFRTVVDVMLEWGLQHREVTIGKKKQIVSQPTG